MTPTKFRAKHGLTQEQAAPLLGVTLRTWARHEATAEVPLLWQLALDEVSRRLSVGGR